MTDAKQAADIEMFARLGHDRFIRTDHQQNQVDAPNASEHVFDESLMPRDIDEPEAHIRIQIEMRETQIDRNSPALLLFQPVCINPCETFDQRGLAMINVTRGPDNNRTH